MSATQHIEWLNLVEKTGPFLSVSVLEDAFPQGLEKVATHRRQRVRSAYDEWRNSVDAADPQLDALHREWLHLVLAELLDYDSSVLKSQAELPASLVYREPLSGVEVRPDFAALAGGTPRLLVARYAPDTDLTSPLQGDDWITASPIDRMTQLCRAVGVRLGLVTNGERWSVVSVFSEGGSSVATWFARIWQQEPVTLQAFVSLLSVRRCFGKVEDTFGSLLQRSQGHQDEVTDTLGEQVRRAVEVLVQALDQADVAHNRQLLVGVTPAQLYEAGLTVMMRLVVLLCAEQRKLLLLDEEIYDQHYAVTTLRARLAKEQKDLTDEVLERRHDAWSRLLAVCRAVFGGIEHDALRLPPLGGSLFDPDRFPFLEGRAAGTSWRDIPASPLPIDNRTVLMLLTALQVLEQSAGAQMLSYEALDVEQIGHVYEGLLERTVKRVPEVTLGIEGTKKFINPTIALSDLEEHAATDLNSFVAFLVERTGSSESRIRKAIERHPDEALLRRVQLLCGNDTALANRIAPFAHLLRADNWGRLLVYPKDAFIVTMGTGRRETGTHYTPKSLTEPVVRYTLEPLVYVGPAEGKPPEEWTLRAPSDILGLKICDMAMGSAAFLVQVCRWLGDRLVESWDAVEKTGASISMEGSVLRNKDDKELLPKDGSERVLIARRLIASRCLYGVDINPMAVELGKVSLWLVTMMKGRPFSFLDHAFKCGDSLLGGSSIQKIENFSLSSDSRQVTFATANLSHFVEEASAKRRALEDLPSNDHIQIEAKNHLHAEAEAMTAQIKALADALIAFELHGVDSGAYEERRADEAEKVHMLMKRDAESSHHNQPSNQLQVFASEQLRGRRPFHWPVEFPEVFAHGGFDAFVGNPPFMGGQKITGALGTDYRDYLVSRIAGGRRGSADLCTYFFLRAYSMLREYGCMGLVATNTISEGDTREVGLDHLTSQGAIIFRVESSRPWPGAATVSIAVLWLSNNWRGGFVIDGKAVPHINSSLSDTVGSISQRRRLAENAGKAAIGSFLQGTGFYLSPTEAKRLLNQSVQLADVILPLVRGEDLNSIYDDEPVLYAINFGKRTLEQAMKYPLACEIVENRVKPERLAGSDPKLSKNWWLYKRATADLYKKIAHLDQVIVHGFYGKHVAFQFVSAKSIFAAPLVVIISDSPSLFAVLQSNLHQAWIQGVSSMGIAIRYTPSDCFETFPFPTMTVNLGETGLRFHQLRRSVMLIHKEGLTDISNRFHDPHEQSPDIVQLRALQTEMDQAAIIAYDWSDLSLGHGFHETKQGVRYTFSELARRSVLERLLTLNHQRCANETAAGPVPNSAMLGSKVKRTLKGIDETAMFL